MNIVLFEDEPVFYRGDPRYEHIKKILKKGRGETFVAGIVNGAKGEATITLLDDSKLEFSFKAFKGDQISGEGSDLTMGRNSWDLYPVTVVLGFPRPIQLKRILRDLASLGVQAIWLCGTDLGEKSYRNSNMVSRGAVQEGLLDGCMQAGETGVPEFKMFNSVLDVIQKVHVELQNAHHLLLDVGEGICSLKEEVQKVLQWPGNKGVLKGSPTSGFPIFLYIGSERGWSENERRIFKEANFTPCSLGHRILRTETACTAAVAITLSELDYYGVFNNTTEIFQNIDSCAEYNHGENI